MNKEYDYVVAGASIAGVCCARFLSEAGFRVLILNEYGFAGGAITEALSLYQQMEYEKLTSCTRHVVDSLQKEQDGLYGRDASGILINPESLKYVLQENIQSHSIDSLFHIKILGYESVAEKTTIHLSGKEGQFQLRCKALIDATDEGNLLARANKHYTKPQKIFYNIIADSTIEALGIAKIRNTKFASIAGNSWFSFELDTESQLSYEQQIHELILNIIAAIEEKNKKIQLLAPKAFVSYSFFEKEVTNYGLIAFPYNTAQDQLIVRSSNFEQRLVDIL